MKWLNVRAGLCLLALGLTSCGGSQIEPFQPRQIILLGDETAVLATDGRHYSMNGTNNGVFDCNLLPTWTQQLVANFGLVLDRCDPSGTSANAITRGAPGARAPDLPGQIDAQLAAGAVTNKDLFVVMVGLNDIIECYETPASCNSPGTTLADRGALVAQQINRVIAAGGRVIASTVHDVGLTPYGRAKDAANSGEAARLTQMTDAFNARVRVDILQDGRFVALVLADDTSRAMVKVPSAFGLGNVTDAACAVPLPACDTSSLVSGATSATHLWDDDRHFGPVMHNRLALLAETRARNNPF
jgi:outer membrane lipase/esterase